MTDSNAAQFDGRDLRRAFGNFATGVTIVTTLDAQGNPCGFTANSFTSVSIDPPLLLVSIAKSAFGCEVFTASRGFAVNILARDQEPLAKHFARKEDEDRRFADLECETGVTGAPLLAGSIASLDCRLQAAHDAGDHVIYIGEVVGLRVAEGDPLLFCNRAYRGLAK